MISFSATYLNCGRVKEMEDSAGQLSSTVKSDYLAIFNESGVPPHKLQLKVGIICSIIHNLFIQKGLIKNARVRIFELRRHIMRMEFLNSAFFSF
jgi:hypothetical protein